MTRPISSQTKRRIQVSIGRVAIRVTAQTIASGAMNVDRRDAERPLECPGGCGAAPARRRRRATNENSVPIETSSPRMSIGRSAAIDRAGDAADDGREDRGLEPGADLAEPVGEQSVGGHPHEDPASARRR